MQQMKEQGKNPPDQTNEEERGSLREKEFRVMIVKMIQNLGNRMEKIQESFNKEVEELKNKQRMMKKTINEIKNSLERINSRITEAEERINGASLVAQWLRVCLLMQGTRVQALVWEDPTCRGATRPVSHNY